MIVPLEVPTWPHRVAGVADRLAGRSACPAVPRVGGCQRPRRGPALVLRAVENVQRAERRGCPVPASGIPPPARQRVRGADPTGILCMTSHGRGGVRWAAAGQPPTASVVAGRRPPRACGWRSPASTSRPRICWSSSGTASSGRRLGGVTAAGSPPTRREPLGTRSARRRDHARSSSLTPADVAGRTPTLYRDRGASMSGARNAIVRGAARGTIATESSDGSTGSAPRTIVFNYLPGGLRVARPRSRTVARGVVDPLCAKTPRAP